MEIVRHKKRRGHYGYRDFAGEHADRKVKIGDFKKWETISKKTGQWLDEVKFNDFVKGNSKLCLVWCVDENGVAHMYDEPLVMTEEEFHRLTFRSGIGTVVMTLVENVPYK